MGFEPTTSCIRGKRLTARPRGPHNRERTTLRIILKHLESIFLHKGTRQIPSGIGKRLQKPLELTELANADQIFSILCRQNAGFRLGYERTKEKAVEEGSCSGILRV